MKLKPSSTYKKKAILKVVSESTFSFRQSDMHTIHILEHKGRFYYIFLKVYFLKITFQEVSEIIS